MSRLTRFSNRAGFTLLELLVAVVITLLIAGVMLAVTTQLLGIWQRVMLAVTTQLLGIWQRQQGAHTQAVAAKLALDFLERDWQAAVYRDDSQVWLAVDVLDAPSALANHGWLLSDGLHKPANGKSLNMLPPVEDPEQHRITQARFGLSGVWLRFVTSNVESGGTLPVAVAYQLVRRPVTGKPEAANPAPVRYALYRSVVSAAETFQAGYDVTSAGYSSADNFPSGALGGAYRMARNVMNPSHANLLAANLVDFGCWFYVREPTGGLRRIYPETAVDLSHHASGTGRSNAARYPEVMDVFVRVLSETGARLIEDMEAGRLTGRPAGYKDDADWWWAVVEAHSSIHTRRIEIKIAAP